MKKRIISHGIVLAIGIALGWYAPKLILNVRHGQMLHQAEKQLSENSNNAQNWMCLGNAKHFKGDYRGALEAYKKALVIDPNYINAYQGIGNYYLNEGDIDQAEEWLKKGLSVAEQHKPEAVYEARQLVEFIQNYRTNQYLQTMYGKGKPNQ